MDGAPAGDGTAHGLRSRGPMPAYRQLSRPDIVRSGVSRRRHALPRLALLRPDRSIDLHHQPVRLRLGGSSNGRAVAGTVVGSIIPSPARAASMVWMSSMACSISSSLIALTPPLC